MGTRWSLRVVSPRGDEAATVQAALDRVVAQMSQWEPDSTLTRINRAPPGAWRAIPPEFAQVLDAAMVVARASGGAFDPAMGRLTELWGFGTAPAPGTAPRPDETDDVRRNAGVIEFDGPGLRLRRTGSGLLDFSGIAKGFGADLAARSLLAQGQRHFLIEVGGELRGHGLRPDGQPWWVDVESPPGHAEAPLRLALHELSAATSGNYRRWLDADGQRYAHSLDPRTGRPIDNGVVSVTVLHDSCMFADAWATALTVLGATEGMALARAQDLAVRMIDSTGEHVSCRLRTMLD